MGVAQQQLSASLRGDRAVLLKHLDELLESDGIDAEGLLLELTTVARRMKSPPSIRRR
jgi:hypothetical protein